MERVVLQMMLSKQCKQCRCWNCRWCGTDNCYCDTNKPCWECNGKRHERDYIQNKIDTCLGWELASQIVIEHRG